MKKIISCIDKCFNITEVEQIYSLSGVIQHLEGRETFHSFSGAINLNRPCDHGTYEVCLCECVSESWTWSENALLLSAYNISLQLAGGAEWTAPGYHKIITQRPLKTQTDARHIAYHTMFYKVKSKGFCWLGWDGSHRAVLLPQLHVSPVRETFYNAPIEQLSNISQKWRLKLKK